MARRRQGRSAMALARQFAGGRGAPRNTVRQGVRALVSAARAGRTVRGNEARILAAFARDQRRRGAVRGRAGSARGGID